MSFFFLLRKYRVTFVVVVCGQVCNSIELRFSLTVVTGTRDLASPRVRVQLYDVTPQPTMVIRVAVLTGDIHN